MKNSPAKIDENINDAKEYLDGLLVTISDPRSQKMLQNVWKALETIRLANGNDYRIPIVAKLTEEMGGPKAQSMRNATGIHFRNLIDKYASVHQRPEQSKGDDPHGKLLKEITDKHTKQHIRLLIQENTSLRNQLNIIKNNVARNAPPILPTSADDQTKSIAGPILSEIELDSIKDFLEGLNKKGYEVNEFGAIIDPDGIEFAPPGLIDALKGILALFK